MAYTSILQLLEDSTNPDATIFFLLKWVQFVFSSFLYLVLEEPRQSKLLYPKTFTPVLQMLTGDS